MIRKYLRAAPTCLAAVVLMTCLATGARGSTELYLKFRTLDETRGITAITFDRGRGEVIYGNEKGGIFAVDIETGVSRLLPCKSGRSITALEISPEGRYIAFASADKKIHLFDLREGTDTELKSSRSQIAVARFSADGRYLAAAGSSKSIFLWEVSSGQLRAELKGHDGEIVELAFNDEEGSIISIGRDRRMIIWDISSMKPLRQVELEARTIAGSGIDLTSARIGADRAIAAVGIDEHILEKGGRKMIFKYHLAFFDIAKGILLKVLEDNQRKIEDFTLYPGNCYVAFDNSTMQNKRLALRNIETGSFDLDYPLGADPAIVVFSPDGRWLAAALERSDGEKPHLYIWDVEYEMPASGCFSGRIRVTSAREFLLNPGQGMLAAVLPFSVAGTDPETGMAAAHFLENALAGSALRLVERSNISDILAELKLQQSGMVDSGSAVEIGRLLGAGFIITGNIDRAGTDLIISARIIDVETGEIKGVREVHCGQCGNDDLYDAIDILAHALIGF